MTPHTRLTALSAYSALLIACLPVQAQVAQGSDTRTDTLTTSVQPDAVLPEVSVSGAQEARITPGARTAVSMDAAALPSALSIVTAEEIATINIGGDISNIFRRVPGVVANSLGQGDTGNGFRMRGFATQGTHGADAAVYVDGVPQNMPSSEAGAGHGPAFLEWLTPQMIERIDVIKGPVSALHGDQNRSGAVNIWTGTGSNTPSSAALTLESYGGKRASVVLGKDYGSFDSLLVADVYRTDSYRRGAWQERDNLFWKLSSVRNEARYSLTLNHYRADFEAAGYHLYHRLAGGLVARDAAQEGALLSYGGGRSTRLVFNRAPASGEAGTYATLYAEDFERVRGTAGGGIVHNTGSDDRFIAGGRVSHNLVFGDRGALHLGAEFRKDKGEGTRQRYENRVATPTYLTYLDMDLLTYGLFAQGQFKPVDSLKLSAGLRADYFDYDIKNRKLPAASTRYRDSVVTPKLGANWSVTPQLDLFANVAQGFRSPAAQQISPAGAAGPLGAAGGAVNRDISPSKVQSYDFGLTAAPNDALRLSGVVFYTLNEDEIVQTGANTFSSVGDTTRKGLELEGRWRFSRSAEVYGAYTRLLQAEINNPAPNTANLLSVARHQFKLGAQYQHALGAGRMRYNVDAYLTSGIPYFSGTPLARQTVPTYTRYDLRATYDYRKLQLAAYAVLQPQMISEAFFSGAAGLSVSPQPPRQFGISARYFF